MMMASFPWHGASNRASLNQQLILLALVLNCPAVGVWGSRGRERLPGGWELVKIRQGLSQVGTTVPGKGCLGKFGPGSVLWRGEARKGKKKESVSWLSLPRAVQGMLVAGAWDVLGSVRAHQPQEGQGAVLQRGTWLYWFFHSSPYDKLVSAFMWILI